MNIEVSTTAGRHFSGLVGVKAGYGEEGELFERARLIEAFKEWLSARHAAKQQFLGAVFGSVEDIVYGFDRDEQLLLFEEPVIRVYGEIASYQEHLSDQEVVAVLQSLFQHLGLVCKQTTVRFTYWGEGGYRESFRLRLPDTSHPLD